MNYVVGRKPHKSLKAVDQHKHQVINLANDNASHRKIGKGRKAYTHCWGRDGRVTTVKKDPLVYMGKLFLSLA